MKKKTLVVPFLLLLLVVGIAFFSSNRKDRVEWRTAKVEQGDLNVVVSATGTLSAVTTVQVGTQVSGTIAKINVDFNSHVKQGQVIAELDKTFLSAAVEDAQANVKRSEVQVRQTKRDLDRSQKLYDSQLASQADFDTATANYENAVASLRSAQSQLDRAQINLHYATITSPIDGVVISRNVDVGQTVAASFNTPTLFTIANDLSKMQVQASVDEADIGKVKLEQRVDFSVDAYPDHVFNGQVAQIRLQPNVSQNVVTYIVIVNVPNPDLKLLPGMTANITFAVDTHKNVLKVPVAALRFQPPPEFLNRSELSEQPNRRVVWIAQGRGLAPVSVKAGLSDGTFTEVSGDLKPGQEVVIGTVSESLNRRQQQTPLGMPRRF